ncbi:MAG: SAM-dependent methyltransferase [Phycisphaerales bacterium]
MARPRELHDKFFKLAKAEGYAARSAYKLKEIQERRRLIRKGDRVLDLGCAPGSWVQVAAELAGPRGLVVGIDLNPVTIVAPTNSRTIVGDIFKITAEELLTADGPRAKRFDVILSDMMPLTEGHGDHFRSIALCRRVLELVPAMLRPGGNLAMKAFEGEEYPALLRETARMFEEVKGLKPEATRDVSKEMFVVAKGWKGTPIPVGTPAKPPAPPSAAS